MGRRPSSSSVMQCNNVLGSLHTQDWEPMTVTLQASHWWKRRSRSKFASHYAWGTNKVCECMICSMDVKSTWIPTWITSRGHLDYFQKPPLGSRPNTKPGDRGTPNAHNCWFILVYHVWGPTWVEIHWTSIWLRVRSHMASTLHLKIREYNNYMILKVCCDGLWTMSFGLSQFHGHGSWLVCEVALYSRLQCSPTKVR